MAIDESLMDELLKHDFEPKSRKTKRLGTLLLQKKKDRVMSQADQQEDHQQQQQQQQPPDDLLFPPAGGDTSIWKRKLTPV